MSIGSALPDTSPIRGSCGASADYLTSRQFSAQGVEIRIADYSRSDTLSAAFKGIDRLLLAAAEKSVAYQDMPKAKFKGALIGMGLPEDVAELIAESDISASKGELEDNGRQLRALISRPTTPYRQTIKMAISAA